jgi:hypothetical protein
MIALNGEEEEMVREFRDLLDGKPPLVRIVRVAVRTFIEMRLDTDPVLKKKYDRKRRHLKLV